MSAESPLTPDHLEAAASAWLARRDRGLLPEEQDAYLQWLREDPAHGRAVARLERAWAELDLLAEWRPEHSTVPNPDLLAAAPAAGGATARARPRRGRVYWLSTAACAAAAALALAFVVSRERPAAVPVPHAVVARDYEQRVLDDGSIVELRRGAAVEVGYTSAERRVRLVRGEALFTVAKNPARPFIVRAGTVDVRALGTVFNVRLDPDSVEVLVTEGKVRVDEAPGRSGRADEAHLLTDIPLLEAGQRAVVSLVAEAPQPALVATVSPIEIERVLAWQPKRLEFNDTPLAEVIVGFNRFNTRQLRLGDPALASLPIGGNFRSDNIDAFVRLLEASFGLEADRIGDEIVLYRAR